MNRFTALPLVALITAAMTVAASAGPAPTRTFELDDVTTRTAAFTSDAQVGTNVSFFLDGTATTYACEGTPNAACERTLVAITGLTAAEIAAAEGAFIFDNVNVNVDISNYSVPVADYDLLLFESDAAGTIGTELGRSGNNPGEAEAVGASVTTTSASPTKYVMVEVVVFASPGSTYDMSISVS